MRKIRKIRKIFSVYTMLLLVGAGLASIATSCDSSRFITYEDGMFDTNEVYQDAVDETNQINSEIENDDAERY